MSIIFELAGEFWIESQVVAITIPDAAGLATSAAVSLAKPGIFLGCSMTQLSAPGANDNSQAVGTIGIQDAGFGLVAFGEFLEVVRMVIDKAAGTAGNINLSYNLLMFMRKRS